MIRFRNPWNMNLKFKRALFFFILIGLVFAFVEGGLRFLLRLAHKDLNGIRQSYVNILDSQSDGKSAYVTDHPYLPHVLRSGAELHTINIYSFGGRVERRAYINTLGFRGAGLESRGPQTFRVACIGGSTVEGSLSDPNDWPHLMGNILQGFYPSNHVEVINGGVSSYASTDTLIHFILHILPVQPDCIVVYDGINDVTALGADHIRNDFSHIRKRIPSIPTLFDYCPRWFDRSALFVCVRRIISDLWLKRTNNIVMLTMRDFTRSDPNSLAGQEIFHRNLMNLIYLCRGYRIRVLLCTFIFQSLDATGKPILGTGIEHKTVALNQIIRQTAAATKTELLELDGALPMNPEYFMDGAHFTLKGERRIAELIAKKLRSMYGPHLVQESGFIPVE